MNLAEENLYRKVKSTICRQIFEGTYQDTDRLPPERKLSEELGISRVTVRKALQLLEDERIISRVQGSGTRVTMHYGAREGDMGIITLVASAQNEFFSRFLDAFQTEADHWDSLVLYKQKPDSIPIEKCLYQIYEKGIRNVVLWPENMKINEETFRVLKGLGLNMVLFDAVDKKEYADVVCMDNADAIRKLHGQLKSIGCRNIGYVSWDDDSIGSLRVREETFQKLEPKGQIRRVPYQYHNRLDILSEDTVRNVLNFIDQCDGVVYAVGELGSTFESYARDQGILHEAGMIGVAHGAKELGIYMIEQDFEKMSAQIFQCLKQQNQADSGWQSGVYYLKGQSQS